MTRERMCAYGNCENTEIRVTVNVIGDERPAFCCHEHAGMWLIQRAVPYLRLRGSDHIRAEISKMLTFD